MCSSGASLSIANGWNAKDRSHLTNAKHLSEGIKPNLLSVTLREGEERSTQSAASIMWVKLIKDEVREQSVVVLVLNKESAIWSETTMKSWLRHAQLTYIDVEGMKVGERRGG